LVWSLISASYISTGKDRQIATTETAAAFSASRASVSI